MKIGHFRALHLNRFRMWYQNGFNAAQTLRDPMSKMAAWEKCIYSINHRDWEMAARMCGYMDGLDIRLATQPDENVIEREAPIAFHTSAKINGSLM